MHRFFVEPALLAGTPDTIMLPDKLAHQVRDVLHLASGEQLVLLDNSGDEVVATVVRRNRTGVEVQYVERHPGKHELSVRIILCQGLLKSARFEWVLEKGTELGVAVFVPTLCHRSMSGLEEAGPAKIERWQRIIQEAAEQCGRSRLPELQPIRALPHLLNDIPRDALALMPWEEEHALSLRDALNAYQRSDVHHYDRCAFHRPRRRPDCGRGRIGATTWRPIRHAGTAYFACRNGGPGGCGECDVCVGGLIWQQIIVR